MVAKACVFAIGYIRVILVVCNVIIGLPLLHEMLNTLQVKYEEVMAIKEYVILEESENLSYQQNEIITVIDK